MLARVQARAFFSIGLMCSVAIAEQPRVSIAPRAVRLHSKGPAPDIRVDVKLTVVPVTVTDALGAPYAGLTREDFHLFEDGVEQELQYLSSDDSPVSVGVIFDASESMTFGEPRKFDFGRQVAAAIGYVALCGFDRVSVIPFPDLPVLPENSSEQAMRGALRAVRGKKSSMQFFRNLNSMTARGSADLNQALRRGALEAKQAGVAIVLSDFLDPAGYEPGLTALIGRGFQVNAIQILAPEELNPTTYGDLRLVDSETGGLQEVTFGKFRLKSYHQTVQNFIQRLREFCQPRGIHFFSVGSDTALEKLLLNQLREAEVWG